MQKSKIELLTFFPFSETNCNNTETIKVINEFTDGKWKSDTFFPNKIENFHGCTLVRILTRVKTLPILTNSCARV